MVLGAKRQERYAPGFPNKDNSRPSRTSGPRGKSRGKDAKRAQYRATRAEERASKKVLNVERKPQRERMDARFFS